MAALLLLTLLSLSPIFLSLALGINIDCGTTGSYEDSNNVTWVGDDDFVTTGIVKEIPNVATKPYNTLRSFPSNHSNCYTKIPVTKDQKTLVRTNFYYSNYDNEESPPSFDLVYNQIHKYSIKIPKTNDEEKIYFLEAIFSPANEDISVCLVRTYRWGTPFISSIEVYSFDAGMYAELGPDESLIPRGRARYGDEEFISYLDPYGRVWDSSLSQENPSMTDLTTSASTINITGASNNPPMDVMLQALSGDFKLALPLTGLPAYLALYFSEPRDLSQTHKRSFNVFLDNKQVGSDPIVPVFGESIQVVERDIVGTPQSQVTFKLTGDSNLPPIINALELYLIRKGQKGGENGGGGGGGGGGEGGEESGFSVDDLEISDRDKDGKTKTRGNNGIKGEGAENGNPIAPRQD
ncbi:uncharacterized protein At1g24485 isoform X2 [Capsella rubella]|uniref:uncharacterized protein At1g24485 isoform X2 n=1 Tax=Capsella rubella TaxID=81985 RepID=UPI000CD5767E|nr:uncharacterized protein At1g24485 isoform X2 [Capsella rubella]